MKKVYPSLATCCIALLFSLNGFGQNQSTFSTIQSIMKTNCGAAGCHGSGDAQIFDVDASSSDLYNTLVNVPAVNTAAAEKGNKIVDPGHPYNSFLLRKIGSNNFDPYIKMDAAEKNGHPSPLQNAEIELIRQWILAGALEFGTAVDYDLLQDYYTTGGIEFIPIPPAPPQGKGFQLRMGPIFLAPNAEVEYMKKEFLNNSEELIVGGLDGYMTSLSHHLLLFKYEVNEADNYREGARRVPVEGFPFNGGQLTGAWQDDGQMELPYGTAFKWAPNTSLDFDYHITNKGQDEILPADFYLNVFYYENSIEPVEMLAELINKTDLFLSQGINHRTDTHIPDRNPANPEETRNIWLITSHTHKFGTDYDIYLRNPDGSTGEQIYEGFFNSNYTANQGVYDWEHPSIRKFEYPLKKFKAKDGLIFETTWDVTSCTSGFPCSLGGCVCFGLTTDDEMMLFTYLYTKTDIPSDPNATAIPEIFAINNFSVYPNPFGESTRVDYAIDKASRVKVEVFDVLGKKLNAVTDEQLPAGKYSEEINSGLIGNSSGIYVVTLSLDGNKLATRKITKL